MQENPPRLSVRDTDFVRDNLLFSYGMFDDDRLLIESFFHNNGIDARFHPQHFYFFMTGIHKKFLKAYTPRTFTQGVDICLAVYARFEEAMRSHGYEGNSFLVKIDNSKQLGVLFSPCEDADCAPETLAKQLYAIYLNDKDPYSHYLDDPSPDALDKGERQYLSTSFVGPYSGYEQIHTAFQEARKLNDLLFFGVRDRVITKRYYEETARPCDVNALLASARRLIHLLCGGTRQQALRQANRVIDTMVAPSYDMTNFHALFIALEDAFSMMETVYPDAVRLPHPPVESFRLLSQYKAYLNRAIHMLFEQLEGRTRYSSTILMALSFIHRNFDADLSLTQVSEVVYANPTALSGAFSAEVGVPFSEYVTGLRVSRAQALLREGTLSVEQIARQCGFASAKYFREVFKRATGLSPRAWRDSCSTFEG